MSAKKADSTVPAKTTNGVSIPTLIAADPQKAKQYRAGWLFGRKKLPRAELKKWLEAVGPKMDAMPRDLHKRKDLYVECPFAWGYFDACNTERIHCSDTPKNECACLSLIDCVEKVGILNGTIRGIPTFCFHDPEPAERIKVIPAPLRALAVADDVINEVIGHEVKHELRQRIIAAGKGDELD